MLQQILKYRESPSQAFSRVCERKAIIFVLMQNFLENLKMSAEYYFFLIFR